MRPHAATPSGMTAWCGMGRHLAHAMQLEEHRVGATLPRLGAPAAWPTTLRAYHRTQYDKLGQWGASRYKSDSNETITKSCPICPIY